MKRIITEYERIIDGERVKVTTVEDHTALTAISNAFTRFKERQAHAAEQSTIAKAKRWHDNYARIASMRGTSTGYAKACRCEKCIAKRNSEEWS